MVGYPKEVAVASLLLLLLSLLLLLRWRQSLVIVIVCGHQDPEFVQPEKGEQSLLLALLLPSNVVHHSAALVDSNSPGHHRH